MKTILLIEDSQEILENTAEILELAGYQVVTADNGKDGVNKAIEHRPDLIISDIMMPSLDGYGVLHLVQKNEAIADTPFIFLTARTERDDFRKGMEMGADDYITKPFNDTELLNAVESRLKKSERIKSHASNLAKVDYETHSSYHLALKELFKNRTQNQYQKKQVIFSEGNHPQYLYYVVRGKVKAYKTSEDGKELTVGLYGPGDFLGYTALLQESVYRVTAKTLEKTELALLPSQDFYHLMNNNTGMAQGFIKMLASNNNQKAEWMVQLAYNSLRKRVANAILLFRDKYAKQHEDNFEIHITREELANLSGTTTESLIRTIRDFKSEKLVDIKDGHIVLLDIQRLKSLLN